MAGLSNDTTRLLYTWILSHLDINGNFYADPVMVNSLVFTRLGHSANIISKALDELTEKGLIVRYEVDGELYLNYPDFKEKQNKLNPDREANPEIPNITQEQLKSNSRATPCKEKLKEVKRREYNNKEKFLEFVFLTKEEYVKLLKKYSKLDVTNKIEDLNNYIGSKGKKYKSHYHTILTWLRKDAPKQDNKQKILSQADIDKKNE